MDNCVHTWVAYKSKKDSNAKVNWCSTCGKVKTDKDEGIIKDNNTERGTQYSRDSESK